MPWIAEDRTGYKFGKWTILERVLPKRPIYYKCVCDCGNTAVINYGNLKSGRSTQCMDCHSLSRASVFIGQKFHYLTIQAVDKVNKKCRAFVKCDCGNERYIAMSLIQKTEGKRIRGKYTACGKCILGANKPVESFRRLEVGSRTGRLTIIQKIKSGESLALCDCGNTKVVKNHHLKTQEPSCGCSLRDRNIENAKKLEGTTYFRLKIIKFLGMGEDNRARYSVKCKCGNKFEQSISYIFGSKSCGCIQKDSVPKGSKQAHSILTEHEAIAIREFFQTKTYTRSEMAKIFNVSLSTICNLIKRKTWKHV